MASNKEEELKEVLYDTEALKRKSVSGFGWAVLQQGLGRIISFTVMLLLARFLTPEDFGALAAVAILTDIARVLSDGGFGASLARSPEVDERDINSVFYFNLAMSGLCYLIIFVAAPWIADFFHAPNLVPLMRVQSLSLILGALGTIQWILIWRAMNFRVQTWSSASSTLVGGIVGCTMANLGYGPWSLVAQELSRAFTFMVFNWYASWWRPKLMFSVPHFKKHFAFGSRMATAQVLTVAYDKVSTILIGRFFSQRELGLFNQAKTFEAVPVGIIADPINQVTAPIFVRIQDDIERLKSGYRRAQRLLFQLSTPVMLALIVLGKPLYLFLFGEKWLDAAPFFQVLCVNGILRPINNYNINVVQVKGRSDLHLKLDIIRKVVEFGAMLAGLWFGGIYGLVWALAVAQVFNLYINTRYSGQLLHFPLREQLGELFPLFLLGLVSGALVWLLDTFLMAGWAPFWRLALGGVTMAASYVALLWLFSREDLLYIWDYAYHHILKRPSKASTSTPNED